MTEAHLDHPGEISWWSGYGPAPVVGPCPHTNCPHLDSACVAYGPDWKHYTLERCVMPDGCNGNCRAWHDENMRTTTPWMQVQPAELLSRR